MLVNETLLIAFTTGIFHMKKDLTLERLKEVLNYSKETGIFKWKKTLSVRAISETECQCRNKKGYIVIRIDGILYKAHRLAWLYVHGHMPPKDIDHKDKIFDHNWILNLRVASKTQNEANTTVRKNNKTGVKGVFPRNDGKYCSQIFRNGKKYHLGSFSTQKEAGEAYNQAAKKFDGEFYTES
jgi:hypothetical protein